MMKLVYVKSIGNVLNCSVQKQISILVQEKKQLKSAYSNKSLHVQNTFLHLHMDTYAPPRLSFIL